MLFSNTKLTNRIIFNIRYVYWLLNSLPLNIKGKQAIWVNGRVMVKHGGANR